MKGNERAAALLVSRRDTTRSHSCKCHDMKSNNLENDEVTRGNSSLTSKSTGASSCSFPSVVECQNDSLFQAAVTKFVNDIIFPRKQFVLLEEELDVEGKLATKCLQEMKLEKANGLL